MSVVEKARQILIDLDPETGSWVGVTKVFNRQFVENEKAESLQPRSEKVSKDEWDDLIAEGAQVSATEYAKKLDEVEEILNGERADWAEEKTSLMTRIEELEASVRREQETNQQLFAVIGVVKKATAGL